MAKFIKCGFLSFGKTDKQLAVYVEEEDMKSLTQEELVLIDKAFDAKKAKEQFIQSTNMANCNTIAMDISNDFERYGLHMSADAVLHGVTKCIGAIGEEEFQRKRFTLGVADFHKYLMDAVYVK